MKNISIFLLLLIGMTACQKAPLDRKLEGMWQLREVQFDDISIEKDSLYMSLQLNVVSLRKARPNNYSPMGEMGYYSYTGDSLNIRMKTSLEFMEFFGFQDTTENFLIEEFTHKNLILRNDYGRWLFRKF